MTAREGPKVCLATATTERFVPGTLVLIGSFLRRHPGFAGDIVVVHDSGLPESLREVLAATFDGVRFHPVLPELADRAEYVHAALPQRGFPPAEFFALEAFRLGGYRKVLFCDSDLLFRAPVDSLFDSPQALLCCGDKAYLEGCHRDALTFLPVPPGGRAGAGGVLERTFNDGFLVIDAALVNDRTYADLLAMLTPETWRNTDTTHTKQFLQNRYFAGRQTLIGSTYNFLLASARDIRAREGVDVESARVLHYVKAVKPWSPDAMLRWAWDPGSVPAASAFRFWYDAWLDVLAQAHVRTGVLGQAGWTFANRAVPADDGANVTAGRDG